MSALLERSARVLMALAGLSGAAAACPTCRNALAGAEARWAQGFGLSIAFLLGVLGLVLGAFALAVWRAVRTPTSS